jgi:hypothetical protein
MLPLPLSRQSEVKIEERKGDGGKKNHENENHRNMCMYAVDSYSDPRNPIGKKCCDKNNGFKHPIDKHD